MKHSSHSTYVPLFVLALSLSIQVLLAQPSTRVLSPHQQLARDIFREVIEINTTMNVGSTKAA